MEGLLSGASSWGGLLGALGLSLVTYLAKRFVIPWLKVGRRQSLARTVAGIADDLIDELRLQYPEREWLKHLDSAVTMLADICDVSPEVARRAVNAAAGRRDLSTVAPSP